MACIYIAISPSGRCYIGQTSDFRKRWLQHFYDAKSGRRPSSTFHRAIRKYGQGKFDVVIIPCSECDLSILERLLIAIYKGMGCDPYNRTDGGEGTRGMILSDEHREKLSAAMRLRKVNPVMLRTTEGKKRSDECRAKIASSARGRKNPPEQSARHALLMRGRVQSLETIEKRRRAMIGHTTSQDTRAKISRANSGRPRTEEWKEKLKLANLGKKQSPETIAKRVVSMKARWSVNPKAGNRKVANG